MPYNILITFTLQNAGLPAQFACGVANMFVLCALDLVMVQFYLDLFRRPKAAEVTTATPAPPPEVERLSDVVTRLAHAVAPRPGALQV